MGQTNPETLSSSPSAPQALIIGIDPGLTGALAIYNAATKELVKLVDLPITAPRDHNELDTRALTELLKPFVPHVLFAVVELVGSAPKQGVASVFKFGFTTGAIHGVLNALGIYVHTVRPAVWKAGYGLIHTDKRASIERAKELMPSAIPFLLRQRDDGRAEALLLAIYGERFMPRQLAVKP